MDYDKLNTRIPSSLRHVTPFLEEALQLLRGMQSATSLKIAICCIDHAFNMISKFDFELDKLAIDCLSMFEGLRDEAAAILVNGGDSVPQQDNSDMMEVSDLGPVTANQILLAEANSTLELAEQQLAMQLVQAAARNYHAATLYYRVIDSIMTLDAESVAKMEYAAYRTRTCSHLIENFVLEHFSGPRCVDVYDIDSKQIGHGAYGSVHLCRHKKTRDIFACKMVSLARISSHYLRKLHLEIAIMKEVDHPNIVKLKEVFFGSRTVYLVMELCEGGELFDQITHTARRGFVEPYAAKLMRDIISSVKYLHDRNIVHRDIKLENFLFENTGSSSRLKLIDFGLSKHFDEHESMRHVVGSAYYTAPEVLNGGYDERCDIWSIGVIAYMLLCGLPPFQGNKSEDIHALILAGNPDLSPTRFPGASPQAMDFLCRLLAKNPDGRMTLSAALTHPFLQFADFFDASLARGASPDVVNSLTHFIKLNKVKKLMLKLVAFTLNPAQIEKLRDDFYAIDKDRNGTISMDELRKALSENNQTEAQIQQSFRAIDASGLGGSEINYSDFLAAAMLKRVSINEDRLELAFETLDADGTGFVDVAALRTSLGTEQSDELLDGVLSELDSNHDGKIDYSEFLNYWRSVERVEKHTPLQRFAVSANKIRAINAFRHR